MSETASSPAAEWRPRANPWLIAIAVMLATFMVILDTTIAVVALPYIAGNLGATQDESTWVLTSYLVANAIILPASTWFSSIFGRKDFLIVCTIIFTVSSVLCGLSTNMTMLVVCRFLQGIGGGAMQPLSQSILLESFPPAKRGAATALFGIAIVVAPIVGPVLGGWLTDNWSWRWVFYINLPVGVLACILIGRSSKIRPISAPKRLADWTPSALPWWGYALPLCKSSSTRGRMRIGFRPSGCAGSH